MEDNRPQRFSDITEDMIRDWKAKYGEYALEELTVPLNADSSKPLEEQEDLVYARFIMAKPNRHTIMAISSNANNIAKSNEILLANCVLGGDMAAINQYGVVFGEMVKWGREKMAEGAGFGVVKKI